jgi:ATP-dependent DNA helicase RecG
MIDNDKAEVKVKIYGKAIDDRYTELLKNDNNLSLKECIWLDAIQKRKPITEAAIKILKSKRLIEGRKPHYYISMDVAQRTHQITEYTNKKGLEKQKLVNMILQYVENSGEMGVMLNDIYLYMEQTLPEEKSPEAKKRQLSYLLLELKKNNKVYTQGLHWHAVNNA